MQTIQNINGSGKNTHGFTIIEIIATLVIMAIISAVAISIFSSTDKYKLVSEVEILKTHLRYAQSRAMSDTVPWGIVLNGCSSTDCSYTLQKNYAATSNLPNENSPTHTLQKGVIVSSGLPVTFDNFGSPVGNLSITLSAGGNRSFTVAANTGFIP